MKKIVHLAVLTTTFATSLSSFAGPLVIYGEDNRKEVYEASEFEQKLARSAATMVDNANIVAHPKKEGKFILKQDSLKTWFEAALKEAAEQAAAEEAAQAALDAAAGAAGAGAQSTETTEPPATPVKPLPPTKKFLSDILKSDPEPTISFCAEERFVDQPNPGACSGFLIAPDLIVTAGHCLTMPRACEDYKWVFDFKVNKRNQKAGDKIPQENIYSCKRFVSGALNTNYGYDFGVIQLDRDVVGREPLKIRTEGKVADDANLVLIGSPSGLPLKVAAGAKVRKNTHPNYFTANTDSYQGNSGSAVFNAETGVVEGILVRGENDFVPNLAKFCFESNKCDEGGCRGEDISRLTSIPEIALNKVFRQVAVTGNLEIVNQVTNLGIWLDFYTANRVTILMEAAAAGQAEVVEALLKAGADASIKDVNGNSTLHYAVKAGGQKALGLVKSLVAVKVDINSRNTLGETALFEAVRAGDVELANSLIALGADVTVKNKKGKKIVSLAKDLENKEFVQTLKVIEKDQKEVLKQKAKEEKAKKLASK